MNPYLGRNAPTPNRSRSPRAPGLQGGFPAVGNGLGGLPKRSLIRVLFGASEQGGLWLPGLNTCYTDNGTTLCTAPGDLVYRMDDLSGRGNHAVQATEAARPALQRTAGGLWYLAFDGTDDRLLSTNTLIDANKNLSVCGAIALGDTNANKTSFFGVGTSARIHVYQLGFLSGGDHFYYSNAIDGGSNVHSDAVNHFLTTDPVVATFLTEIGAKIAIRKNQAALTPLVQSGVVVARDGNNGFSIGRRSDSTAQWFKGNIFGLCVTETVLSGDLLNQVESFMANRAGVTLP